MRLTSEDFRTSGGPLDYLIHIGSQLFWYLFRKLLFNSDPPPPLLSFIVFKKIKILSVDWKP